MEKENDIIISAVKACDDVLMVMRLATNAQIPHDQAALLVHLANENGYTIEIINHQVYLVNPSNGKRTCVRYHKVSDEMRKWMYGIVVKPGSSLGFSFRAMGSFQKEIEAEQHKLKGEVHTIKAFNNTRLAILETDGKR